MVVVIPALGATAKQSYRARLAVWSFPIDRHETRKPAFVGPKVGWITVYVGSLPLFMREDLGQSTLHVLKCRSTCGTARLSFGLSHNQRSQQNSGNRCNPNR